MAVSRQACSNPGLRSFASACSCAFASDFNAEAIAPGALASTSWWSVRLASRFQALVARSAPVAPRNAPASTAESLRRAVFSADVAGCCASMRVRGGPALPGVGLVSVVVEAEGCAAFPVGAWDGGAGCADGRRAIDLVMAGRGRVSKSWMNRLRSAGTHGWREGTLSSWRPARELPRRARYPCDATPDISGRKDKPMKADFDMKRVEEVMAQVEATIKETNELLERNRR